MKHEVYMHVISMKNTSKQQGDTCITMMERYVQYVKEKGKYSTGLGRWYWVRIQGNNEISTTVIAAYLPCWDRKISMLFTYTQQKRYWRM